MQVPCEASLTTSTPANTQSAATIHQPVLAAAPPVKRLSENYDVAVHSLGPLNEVCANDRCGALHWSGERTRETTFMDCCFHGKLHFDDWPPYPDELRQLLERDHPRWRNFHENIRKYNASVQFISLKANVRSFDGGGPYAFKIQGKVYTNFNQAMEPDIPYQRRYGQLFVVDTDTAVSVRMNNPVNEGMLKDVADLIDVVLRRHNPFVHAFQMMREVIEEQRSRTEEVERSLGNCRPIPEPEVRLVFCPRNRQDPQDYNIPTSSEVAAVFVTDADGNIPEPYITVHERGHQIRRIHFGEPLLEPMAFPLIVPGGQAGYSYGMSLQADVTGRSEISRAEYASWRMSVREGTFNPLHRCGKLFQEWAVSTFIFMEGDRLNFIRLHQKELFAERYDLRPFLEAAAAEYHANVGDAIILPATYPGSSRFWQNNFEGKHVSCNID